MKILVLATDYSRPDGYMSLHYIHTRNKWYTERGIDVSVISFSAKEDYIFDGINVYTVQNYKKNGKESKYDLLISHAPNLRNHYRFIRKYEKRFNHIIFFFHGHEVLIKSQIYPKPYDFDKNSTFISRIINDVYDRFKLAVWQRYFRKTAYKSHFIFVSNWMYNMFMEFIKLDPKIIDDKKHIIYNCIGKEFEDISYNKNVEKKYDFITIRNSLDGSKYGIDIVNRIAERNPKYKFCVVAKGEYYNFNRKPENLDWIDKNLTHKEIIEYLNKSHCALLPTRTDAQGVMACEVATFGIPLITSEIDVTREVFGDFNNVAYIDNDMIDIDIEPIFQKLINLDVTEKNTKYFAANTIGKEIGLFNELTERVK